jgi:site-specific DNA recombinase
MKAAIYSRKSRFTGKGESTQNQIEICKDYAKKQFNIDEFIIYEDEGFSGGHTDRPEFQKMIKHTKEKKFDILICYRLDRISRNISDFSNLIEILNEKNIGFVSVRESFDTTTPMGRAMMYIASVFAQLERETIAERVRDNMHQLARSGRWLGGNRPTGYESEPIIYIDNNMKEKKMYKLIPVKKDLDTVKLLFEKYLEFESLQKVETYCLQNNIKTKNGNDFHKNTIKFILTNPVYAIADEYIYEYFKANNAEICADKKDFNGKYGVIGYNKKLVRNNKFIKFNDVNEWIVAIGKHKGIIPGKDWVRVQKLFKKNRDKFPRTGTSHTALLSGLLSCKKCGSFMRVTYGNKIKGTDRYYHYYECNLRFNSKRKRCNNKRLSAIKVDDLIIEKIKKTISPAIFEKIDRAKESLKNKNKYNNKIKDKILSNKKSIENLVKQLSNANDEIAQYLLAEINKLHEENKVLEAKIKNNNVDIEAFNLDIFKDSLIKFNEKIDTADFNEKRNLIRSVVKRIEWDGENLDIRLLEYDV